MTPHDRLVEFMLRSAAVRRQGTAYWVDKYGTKPWPFYTKDPARAVRRLLDGKWTYLVEGKVVTKSDYTQGEIAGATRVVLTALALEDA